MATSLEQLVVGKSDKLVNRYTVAFNAVKANPVISSQKAMGFRAKVWDMQASQWEAVLSGQTAPYFEVWTNSSGFKGVRHMSVIIYAAPESTSQAWQMVEVLKAVDPEIPWRTSHISLTKMDHQAVYRSGWLRISMVVNYLSAVK